MDAFKQTHQITQTSIEILKNIHKAKHKFSNNNLYIDIYIFGLLDN